MKIKESKIIEKRILISDLFSLVFGQLFAYLLVFGFTFQSFKIGKPSEQIAIPYFFYIVLIIIFWSLLLSGIGARNQKFFGFGPEEYKLVLYSSLITSLVSISIFFVFLTTISRLFIFVSFVSCASLLLYQRHRIRRKLAADRERGKFQERVILVGSPEAVSRFDQLILHFSASGLLPVGALVHGEFIDNFEIPNANFVENLDLSLIQLSLKSNSAEAIVFCSMEAHNDSELKAITWSLEDSEIRVYIASGIYDVVGPRIKFRNLVGLGLLEIEVPTYSGLSWAIKRSFDIVISAFALVILSPVLLVLTLILLLIQKANHFSLRPELG